MSYWGKVIGGMAGFAMGGPFGALVGAALGHAADSGALPRANMSFGWGVNPAGLWGFNPARIASMFAGREQLFALAVVVLSAKLAKCDGPVVRAEVDAFKRHFRIPPESVRDIGRLFDRAREDAKGFEGYADQLGELFSDNRGMLEDVLAALFAIARADRPLNQRELAFLMRVHRGFGLDQRAWERVQGGTSRQAPAADQPDSYAILGISAKASDEEVRLRWRQLMRENHPDSLASRGVPAEFIARANEKVARINAAWDRIKRERGL